MENLQQPARVCSSAYFFSRTFVCGCDFALHEFTVVIFSVSQYVPHLHKGLNKLSCYSANYSMISGSFVTKASFRAVRLHSDWKVRERMLNLLHGFGLCFPV